MKVLLPKKGYNKMAGFFWFCSFLDHLTRLSSPRVPCNINMYFLQYPKNHNLTIYRIFQSNRFFFLLKSDERQILSLRYMPIFHNLALGLCPKISVRKLSKSLFVNDNYRMRLTLKSWYNFLLLNSRYFHDLPIDYVTRYIMTSSEL